MPAESRSEHGGDVPVPVQPVDQPVVVVPVRHKLVLKTVYLPLIFAVFCLFVFSYLQGYFSRRDLTGQLRTGCHRSVSDRQNEIRLLSAGIVANAIVANDPAQPKLTRDARAAQVRTDRQVIASARLRVPPVFSCDRAYPEPSLLP